MIRSDGCDEVRPPPLVSVLVPTFCRSDLLSHALASAVAQTYRNLEILVLDDNSPDDGRTARAVEPFVVADARVRYIRNSTNLGITGNWRAGIEQVVGEFFCLLHDDDTIDSTFVADLVAAVRDDSDAVIAFCDHWVTDANGRRRADVTEQTSRTFGRVRLPAGPLADFARAALIDTSISIGATLFRRADVTPDLIDDHARGSIDMWLLYGCVKSGKRAVYVPKRLMDYRSHAGGMSASQPLYMTEGHLWRYDRMLADGKLLPIQVDLRAARERTLGDYGVHLLAAGRRQEARVALAAASGYKAAVGRALAHLGPVGTAIVRLARKLRHID